MNEHLAEYFELPEEPPDEVLRMSVHKSLERGNPPEKVLLWFGPRAQQFIEEFKK